MLLLPLLYCFNGIFDHLVSCECLVIINNWNSDGNIVSLSNMNSFLYAELISEARLKVL